MSEHTIALQLLDRTPRAKRAVEDLVRCLGAVKCSEPDGDGTFEVRVDCESQETALQHVWDAMAAAGADDHLVIMEHPHIERHWEHRADGPVAG
jgi:hypothetical protein